MQMDLKLAHEEFERGITHTGFHFTMSLIKRKYKLGIIYCLMMNGPTRYNELKRKIRGITNTMLASSLKELEEDGLVLRTQYMEMPLRVEYETTDACAGLMPILRQLAGWGMEREQTE